MLTTLTYITSALSSGQKRELRGCSDVNLLLEISGRGPLKIQRVISYNSRPSDHPAVYQSSLTTPHVTDTRKSINQSITYRLLQQVTSILACYPNNGAILERWISPRDRISLCPSKGTRWYSRSGFFALLATALLWK